MALAAPPSQAALPFLWTGAFAGAGPDEHLHHQQRLAVEHSTGHIFRTDVVADQIVVYAPAGTSASQLTTFGSGELSDPYGIAVDQANGAVYVSDAGNDRIVRYTSDGAGVPTYTRDVAYSGPAPSEVGSFRAAIAIDPSSGDLLVADPGDDLVRRYDDAGVPLGSFDGTGSSGTFTGLQDLAVDSTGDVIVVDSVGGDPADGAASRVERFNSSGAWEETIGPVAGAATVAVRPFNDEVVVSGNQDAVNRDQLPTIFSFDATSSAETTFGTNDVQWSTISGLALDDGPEGRLYVATDTGRGDWPYDYGYVSVQVFDAAPIPTAPEIELFTPPVSGLTPFEATMRARIMPGNAETTYYFEYGTSPAYGSQTAPGVVAAGLIPTGVTAPLQELEPSTTYHFRVVVDNGVGGPVASANQTFTTPDRAAQAVIGGPTGVGTTRATVHGHVTTHGHSGSYRFAVIEVGGLYQSESESRPLVASGGQQQLSEALHGLEPGTTYAVQLVGETTGGKFFSGWREFTTASPPVSGFANPTAPVLPPVADVCPDPKLSPRDGCEPPVATPPSNAFRAKLGKGRVLRVAVPGAGTVRVAGSGVRGVVRRPAGKRRVTIRIALTKAGRRALARSKSGKLRRTITVSYRPSGGSTRSVKRRVTFAR